MGLNSISSQRKAGHSCSQLPDAEHTSSQMPSAQLASITRKRNQLEPYLLDVPLDLDVIKKEYNEYLKRVETLYETCNDLRNRDGFDTCQLDSWLFPVSESINSFRQKVDALLARKPEPTPSLSNRSRPSNASVGGASGTSSARIRLAQQRAKIAAEKSLIEKTEELEAEELKIKQKQRTARLERDQIEAEILEDELERMDKEELSSVFSSGSSKASRQVRDYPRGRPSEGKKPTLSLLRDALTEQSKAAQTLVNNQERMLLPKRELRYFDGEDTTEFKTFIRDFDRSIDMRCKDDIDKLSYLEYYTKGRAKKLVQSCCHSNATTAYRNARQLLHEEFDNKFKVSAALIQNLEQWPQVKIEDPVALEDFAMFLLRCNNYMSDMEASNPLDNPKEIMCIVRKLPYKFRERWRRTAFNITKTERPVKFGDLVAFVREESAILRQPLFAAISDTSETSDVQISAASNYSNKEVSFATAVERQHQELGSNTQVFNGEPCVCCKKNNHFVARCIFLKKKPASERLDFVRRAGLCFACLRAGHAAANCTSKLTCDLCRGNHPTILHDALRGNVGDSQRKYSSAFGNTDSHQSSSSKFDVSNECRGEIIPSVIETAEKDHNQNKVMCPVVPALVYIGESRRIAVNVALDPFSSNCWANEALINSLGAKSGSTEITLSTMEKKSTPCHTRVVNNLMIADLSGNNVTKIALLYTKTSENWPFSSNDLPSAGDIKGYPHLGAVPFEFIGANIDILIGLDVPWLIKPLDIVSGKDDEPYASLHLLGWALNGPIRRKSLTSVNLSTITAPVEIEESFDRMFSQDFSDTYSRETGPSMEDIKWHRIVEDSIKRLPNKRYEIDLPLKENSFFPNNKNQALARFLALKKRFIKNEKLRDDYCGFMKTMIDSGFMERVPENELEGHIGKTWYLVHHPVYHKVKQKIRVVFDCSLKYSGVSLNDNLLQGPDLTNRLLGVLLRFRENKVAFISDIEKMYYQVRVPGKHADLLRLFWYSGESDKIVQYRLLVHVFGARSSPSVAAFALRRAANDNLTSSERAKNTVARNFYVDDLLKSSPDYETALDLFGEVKDMLGKSGFNLTGFRCNGQPSEERSCELPSHNQPEATEGGSDRVLGVVWRLDRDTFGYCLGSCLLSPTRRNLLRIVASVYDPLGIIGPVLVPARKLFQESCKCNLAWDDELPYELLSVWKKWVNDVTNLSRCEVPRCIKPVWRSDSVEVHVFCDGSQVAYGSVSYLRYVDGNSVFVSAPVMAKSRLTPSNNKTLKTIPRIELCSAYVGIIVLQTLRQELDINFDREFLWTDSTTVLKYINNDTARFQKFVANKVSFIRNHSIPSQWRHVPSQSNPADLISRGCTAEQLMKSELWFAGPSFLREDCGNWPGTSVNVDLGSDPEVKKNNTRLSMLINAEPSPTEKLLSSSSWHRLKVRVAWMLRLKSCLRGYFTHMGCLSVPELQCAETEIWKYVQRKELSDVLNSLTNKKILPKRDCIAKLQPFTDNGGILRVGGRLQHSTYKFEVRHPIMLPGSSDIVKLYVRDLHRNMGHLGREVLLSKLRRTHWIIGGSSLVRQITRNCIICRKIHSRPQAPLMASLPSERVTGDSPPFSATGIDYFGPFLVSIKRSQEKRYGVVFTCMASRAIHLEVARNLSTDSFICALRRFVSRRGNVISFSSDNGTNFVGAQNELKLAINTWNMNTIETWLKQRNITWNFRPPMASHFGGVWEREIRTVRNVLTALMNEQPIKLNDETLATLFCEIEAILNNRPLNEITSDHEDLEALTPNHLLLWNAGVTYPPGLFNVEDSYGKRRWKQVQYLADLFWSRWRKEYLPLLQVRQKWNKIQEPFQVGDLVLVTDQLLPRNHWSLGRIVRVKVDKDGCIRVAHVKIAKYKDGTSTTLGTTIVERPVIKLILLRSSCNE